MLGLGNAINKARVYKTFVGEVITYDYIANGQPGEGGFIFHHILSDADGNPQEEATASHITYTEVFAEALTYNGLSKATAQEWGPEIENELSNAFTIGETVTVYDDWRMIYSGVEFESWNENIYSDAFLGELFFTGDAENPYITVRQAFWPTWSAGTPPFASLTSSNTQDFDINHTDGTDTERPTEQQLLEVTYYTLAVRTFTEPMSSLSMPLPSTEPTPTAPNPLPFQQRSSGDLTGGATDSTSSEDDQVLDLSINADVLTGSDVNLYLFKPANTPDYANADERFKIQFKIEWLVNSISGFGSIPTPWEPSNTEQKKLSLTMAKIGWEDKPLVDHLNMDAAGLNSFGGWYAFSEYLGSLEAGISIDLNKITQDDLPSGMVALGDGFWADYLNNKLYFGYVGYLDIGDFKCKFLGNAYEQNTIKELSDDLNFIGNLPDWKKFFILRVADLRFFTDVRPESDRVVLPQNLKYILYPFVAPSQMSIFYNYVDADDLTLQGFVNSVFTAQSQNEPPLVSGDNEDYYN